MSFENQRVIALATHEFIPKLFPEIYVDIKNGTLIKLERDENGTYPYKDIKINIAKNGRFELQGFVYRFTHTQRQSDGTLQYVWTTKE